MNCAGAEVSDSSEVFDCKDMGDVLGKNCKDEEVSFAHSAEDIDEDNADGGDCSNPDSESDSDKVKQALMRITCHGHKYKH